ncbi:MAG TPA: hypothetical protein VMT62_09495 [Syntrophorhabdaceae bacterium]|nr:hypothetical protein [Syntrophorhabdaceae bacterium]
MNMPAEQRTENATEIREFDLKMQSLRQYLSLLGSSLDRYEYLKKSGAPDVVLYTEKGLINRQLMFLSKICSELIR